MSPLGWIMAANIAVFALEVLLGRWVDFFGFFGLSYNGLVSGRLWTLLTYSFIHEGLLHLGLNLLLLYWTWQGVAAALGHKRCVWVYFLSILGGAALWMLASGYASPRADLIGASAGVFGMFTLFCFLNWNRPITLLLFFIFPIRIEPKWLLIIFGSIELFSSLTYEILPHFSNVSHGSPIAFSAHLGGLATAWLCYKYLLRAQNARARPSMQLPAWMKRKKATTTYRVNYSDRLELNKTEVNRVLDKIAQKGFASLTNEERDLLERARETFKRD